MKKKRERAKRKDNIVFFPGFEEKLADKGLESLQNKKFQEAINLLEEAREHDPENGDVLIGLVLAYFEAGAYSKAKELASQMLLKGIGDYFQMVDLYLTILIQLHEYQEIVTTIEALLDEKEIPPDKHDHFLTILQFSRRMADSKHADEDEEDLIEPGPQKMNLQLETLNEQMMIVASLAEKNIRPYMEEIKDYLYEKTGHPFVKTMLLILLKEQEYANEVKVNKFDLEVTVVPAELPDIKDDPRLNEIIKHLEDKLESDDPILFENIKDMAERIFYISYPLNLMPETSAAWAGAFHLIAKGYFGIVPDLSEISSEYKTSPEDIKQAINQIRNLEEISYPNI